MGALVALIPMSLEPNRNRPMLVAGTVAPVGVANMAFCVVRSSVLLPTVTTTFPGHRTRAKEKGWLRG